TAQLTKIKSTPEVKAVFVFGAGQGPAIATKNYRQLDIPLPLYQSHGVASEEYIRLSGPAANGVRLPAGALIVADQLPDNDPQKPVVMAYQKAFVERYNTPVSTFGGHAYDAIMIATEAMKKAGTTDKAKVRDAIEQTSGFMGTSGPVNMTPKDHAGLGLTAFRLVEIRNDAWTIVD
ncbi:MAG: ABC transporter substrate-binding protein, partial [Gammaproteobacteria bacterium]